ncbi:replication initiator protein A [Acutalibacter intestini]|uniref:replication initiator protein A n=1 Tax=Acutalibacter intestini TaxID=3093659 RepID=UPI003F58BE31
MRNRSHRQEVKTIAEYITIETIMPPFFRYPRFLLKMDLSQTAKLLYSPLFGRSELSQKNGWQDNEGKTYIVYPVSKIAEMLDKGSTAIKAALNELDAGRASGEGTPGLLRTEPPLCENTANASGSVFRCSPRWHFHVP